MLAAGLAHPEARALPLLVLVLGSPLFLLLACGAVINQLDSVSDLAVIPLGQLLGVEVSAGKVFNALLVIYLVLMGCGPPAAVPAQLRPPPGRRGAAPVARR